MVMRLSLYRVNDVPYVLQELFKIAGIWFFILYLCRFLCYDYYSFEKRIY